MEAYTTRDVARLLGLSEAQVRCQARSGFLRPGRGPRNSYRFSFQDLVLLRTARELADSSVPPKRIRGALCRLARRVPDGRPLSALRIMAEGQRVIVLEDGSAWNPESDQLQIDFTLNKPAAGTSTPTTPLRSGAEDLQPRDAEEWFELALELEESAPAEAELAYARALVLEPDCPHAHVNLGRLLQLSGNTLQAIEHYHSSLRCGSTDPTAAFNLGTALETLHRWTEAIRAYAEALQIDQGFADAHFNLARLYEQTGKRGAAVRHLRAYEIFSGCVSS